MMKPTSNRPLCPVILVTGSAKRIGAEIIRQAHSAGYHVIIHYHHSNTEAMALANELNTERPNSAKTVQADLAIVNDKEKLSAFVNEVISCFGQLDALVNNASRFYPTPIGKVDNEQWQELFLTNAKAPLLFAQAFLPFLTQGNNTQQTKGSIINILDIHADGKPFKNYAVYCMAKSASRAMVQSLALELAPDVRVNGIAPGANVFPEITSDQALSVELQQQITVSIPIQRIGSPADIANAVMYLLQAEYVTGHIITIDGGRSLTLAG